MKWSGRLNRLKEWHRWYAWRPVNDDAGTWYWLRFVERRLTTTVRSSFGFPDIPIYVYREYRRDRKSLATSALLGRVCSKCGAPFYSESDMLVHTAPCQGRKVYHESRMVGKDVFYQDMVVMAPSKCSCCSNCRSSCAHRMIDFLRTRLNAPQFAYALTPEGGACGSCGGAIHDYETKWVDLNSGEIYHNRADCLKKARLKFLRRYGFRRYSDG